MGGTGFTARLIGTTLAVVLAAAAAMVALWVYDHQRRLDDAMATHAGFVLTELKAALEARLNLGLTLTELPQVDALLEQAGAELPGLRSIAVVDDSGKVVFSTDPVEVGETLPLQDMATGADLNGLWNHPTADSLAYGVALTNSFETAEGAVLLRVASGALSESLQDFALVMALEAVAVAMALGPIAAFCLFVLSRRARHAVDDLAVRIDTLATDGMPSGRVMALLPVAAFATAIRARVATLEAADDEVSRLDEMA